MWQPIEKKTVVERVYEELSRQILGGKLRPGETLPPERKLSDLLAVNRSAVREALKRLEQARLVAIQQGGGTRVRDFLRSSGMDLLVHLIGGSSGQLNNAALRALIELRFAVGPDIARRAALRSPECGEAALQAAKTLHEAKDVTTAVAGSFAFWDALILGSGNVAYRLAFNTISEAVASVGPLFGELLADELADDDTHRALAAAVTAGDEARAEELARKLCALTETRAAALPDNDEANDDL